MSGDGQLELYAQKPKRVRGARKLRKGARMRLIERPDMTSWARADVGIVGTIGDPWPMKEDWRRGARDVIGYYQFFPDDGQRKRRHSDEPIAVTSLDVEPE